MNSLIKVSLLISVFLCCVGVTYAAEEKKEPRYSSFECKSYNSEDAEDLSMRNCILRDVVIASEKGQPMILFYAGDGRDTPLLAADKAADKGRIVEMAPRMYASVKVVREALPEEIEPVEDTAVLMTAQSNGLAQFMFDTLYGVYWMLSQTGDINATTGLVRDTDAVTVIEVGRPNDYTRITQGSFTSKAPAPLRYLRGVFYSRVVVGPAGHQVLSYAKGNKKTVQPDLALLQQYRSFFRAVAKTNDEEYDPSRVIVSQRFTTLKLMNGEKLLSKLSEIGSAQVAFLAQLPIKSQIDLIAGSGMFISMHCDDMAYMLFLRPGTSLIELFPYGVDSDVYRKLAALCGIKYNAWHNTDRTRAHFDESILDKYPLTAEQKRKIIDADKYDASLPSGALAYWENQDVNVDIDAVVSIVKSVVPPSKPKNADKPGDEDDDDDDDEEQEPIRVEL